VSQLDNLSNPQPFSFPRAEADSALPMQQRDKERWFPPQGQLEMLEPGWLEVSSKNYLNNS
jgi:hypothetical protein